MALTLNSAGRLLALSSITLDGGYSLVFFYSRLAVFSLATKLQINSYAIDANSFLNVKLCQSTPDIVYALTNQGKLLSINWRSPQSSTSPVETEYQLPSLDSDHRYSKILSFVNDNSSVVNFLTQSNDAMNYSVVQVDLDSNSVSTLASFTNISTFAVSSNSQNLCFVDTHNHQLYLLSLDPTFETVLDQYTIPYVHKTPITTMAISNDPETPYVALGSSSGIIQLIFVNVQQKTSTQRILKWHINQPLTLNFTPDNEYLISGGSEKVLVFWNVISEKQQFLPRMNGSIVDVTIDSRLPSLYGITLGLIDGEKQYLILSSTDLISKFDVFSPRIFNGLNDFIGQYIDKRLPLVGSDLIDINNGPIMKNLQRELKLHNKKSKNQTFNKFKYLNQLKTIFKINPLNDQLYIPSGSYLQVYNLTRPSDSSLLSIAPLVQQYGKVGNEQKIRDPLVKFLQFTPNGQWLVTLDIEFRGEVEMDIGKSEEIETLRFWKLINNEYTLQTKISMSNTKISNILTGPLDYFNGESLLTVDTKGEIKLWRPNSSNVWTLRKYHSFGNDDSLLTTGAPLLAWSADSSLISLVMGSKIKLLDINSFKPIDINLNLELQDSQPNFIKFLNSGKFLLLNTKTHIVIYDILNGQTKWGLITGNNNSIVNSTNDELIIVSRFINDNQINSKVSIWGVNSKDEIVCNYNETYNGIVTGVEYSQNWEKWVLVDLNAQIGTIDSINGSSTKLVLENDDEELQIDHLLNNAIVINQNKKSKNNDDMNDSSMGLKNGVFDLMLTDLEGLSVDILFDRIVKVL